MDENGGFVCHTEEKEILLQLIYIFYVCNTTNITYQLSLVERAC